MVIFGVHRQPALLPPPQHHPIAPPATDALGADQHGRPVETPHATLLQLCEDNLQATGGYSAILRPSRAAVHAERHQFLALLHNVMYCAASRKS
jgi:hypothetical protein